MNIREQLYQVRFNKNDVMTFPDGIMCLNDKLIDKILEIPDIKETLSLLKLKRQGKLVKLADYQDKPSIPDTWGRCQQHDAYALAQHDMEITGFKRVETL
jgi:hypothetical protein